MRALGYQSLVWRVDIFLTSRLMSPALARAASYAKNLFDEWCIMVKMIRLLSFPIYILILSGMLSSCAHESERNEEKKEYPKRKRNSDLSGYDWLLELLH